MTTPRRTTYQAIIIALDCLAPDPHHNSTHGGWPALPDRDDCDTLQAVWPVGLCVLVTMVPLLQIGSACATARGGAGPAHFWQFEDAEVDEAPPTPSETPPVDEAVAPPRHANGCSSSVGSIQAGPSVVVPT